MSGPFLIPAGNVRSEISEPTVSKTIARLKGIQRTVARTHPTLGAQFEDELQRLEAGIAREFPRPLRSVKL